MGVLQWTVQPLSALSGATTSYSAIYDLMDSQEVHALLKVASMAGTSPTLDVSVEHGIDGINFSALSGTTFNQVTGTITSATAVQIKSASVPALRYARFKYVLAGTTPVAVFETQLFVKTLQNV